MRTEEHKVSQQHKGSHAEAYLSQLQNPTSE
jgi:hypothetical protein